ncbi:MAG TPA: hypothetical protein IAA65_03080 [Candidatus Galloscillospira excrementipullorum]|nr:hypothetical protein [Candidatus Galloscillospira excrementipullorum]
MSAPRRFGGLLFLAPVILALAFFWHYRALWQSPSDHVMADMPEEEFADNASLTMLPTPEPLDTELTAQGYLDLLAQMREPERMLWEGLITVSEGSSSRSFFAAYRKDGENFSSELREYGSVRRGLRRQDGNLTLTVDGISTQVRSSDATTPLAAIGMVDISTLLSLSADQIAQVRYDVLDGEQVVYVSYQDPELPLEERYWISLSYAIPLLAETWQDGEKVYEAKTTYLSDDLGEDADVAS